jgi:uncharacterized protein YfeS
MGLPPYAKAWAAQWRAADDALAEVSRRELASLSDEQALLASDALLALADPSALGEERLTRSGLVEQQRLFGQLRRAG